MIPISSSTNLSIEKTAKLLQNLVDLKNNNKNIEYNIPEDISESIDNLLEAQQLFLKEIDDYLHRPSNFKHIDNIETVSTIVNTCPEFLATKDEGGWLPCHAAARAKCTIHSNSNSNSNSSYKHLLLFAGIGCDLDIGGKDKRGGLLMPNDFGWNTLHLIRDPNVFDALQKHNPSLFYKEDIQTYNLLHTAIGNWSVNLVQYFCELYPSYLHHQMNSHNGSLIHRVITRRKNSDESLKIVQYLLRQNVLYSVSNESIGGLFTKVPNRDGLVLNALVKRWGKREAWDCIEKALCVNNTNLDKLPILHQTIRYAPQYCTEVINRFPKSSSVIDCNDHNRLPIHVALETGMKWSLELSYLMKGSEGDLKEMDPKTKWPPFVLAAVGVGTSCDLRTIYQLIREYPEHVEMWCDGGGRYKHVHVQNSKRRKMNYWVSR